MFHPFRAWIRKADQPFSIRSGKRQKTRSPRKWSCRLLRIEELETRITPATYTVINTLDSGAGSLRAAITSVNADTTPDIIDFNIPKSDSGYNSATGAWTIAPGSALPIITNSVLIAGTSQPGYADSPVIELDGVHTPGPAITSGLIITPNNCTVMGLDIVRFYYGLYLDGNSDVIEGNYIGTAPDGMTALPNLAAMCINGSGNMIGGTSAQARNLISGNQDGIEFFGGVLSVLND